MASTPETRGYKARKKKGKPINRKPIERHVKKHSDVKISVTGPDFVGCTTTVQILKQQGYKVAQLAPKPPPGDRQDFSREYFDLLVSNWRSLSATPGHLVIEDSPWAYLLRHSCHVAPSTRAECQAALAPLDLPHLHVVLHTSGVAIGRRHPHFRDDPESYSPLALRQMTHLNLLARPCFFVDASVAPPLVAKRAIAVLEKKVFRVDSATLDGLEHLTRGNPSRTASEC